MSAPIKLYHDNLSQPSRALYLFLKINNIPFESCVVTLRSGEHATKDYRLNVNRFATIPCINDNGFRLAETPAILQYLVAKHRDIVADHWYPRSDVQARARIDEYLSWHHANVRAHLTAYFWNHWAIPRMFGGRCEERLAMARENMISTLDFLENEYLQEERRFIAGGDRISIADLLVVSELLQLCLTDYDISEGRPKIKRYIKMVSQATQPHFIDTFAILHKVAQVTHQSKLKL